MSAADRAAAASGLHAVPAALRDEIVLHDRTTNLPHRIWIQDGVLVWDRGGQKPWVALHLSGRQVVVDLVEPG